MTILNVAEDFAFEENEEDDITLKKLILKQKRMTQKLLKLAQPIIDTVPHLIDLYGLEDSLIRTPLMGETIKRSIFGGGGFLP